MPDRIEEAWQSLYTNIFPNGCPDAQRRDLRRCFYAGALSLRNILFSKMSGTEEVTAEDEALMESVSNELDTFSLAVIQDRD